MLSLGPQSSREPSKLGMVWVHLTDFQVRNQPFYLKEPAENEDRHKKSFSFPLFSPDQNYFLIDISGLVALPFWWFGWTFKQILFLLKVAP